MVARNDGTQTGTGTRSTYQRARREARKRMALIEWGDLKEGVAAYIRTHEDTGETVEFFGRPRKKIVIDALHDITAERAEVVGKGEVTGGRTNFLTTNRKTP